jgi:hypothetical protein
MNAINRAVIVILLLVTMIVCSTLLVRPATVLNAVAQQSSALASLFAEHPRFSGPWLVRVFTGGLFALALDIVLVLFLILEVRRPKPKAIRVEQATGGEVEVSINSIADRLKYEVDQLPGVLRVKPRVSARRGGVVIALDVETIAGVEVPQKAEQIVEMARQVVEDRMGLKISKPPKVNLRAVPYSKMSKIPAEPEYKKIPPVEPLPELPQVYDEPEEYDEF